MGMAKFSVIDDDDEEGPVIYKRRRFSQRPVQRFRSWIVAEEEEEEDLIPIVDLVSQDESDTICPVFNNNGNRRRRQLHVAIIDPDLLECPICLDQLFTPVFQCDNGHIACSSCCSKVNRKCPFCSTPIGSSNNRCAGLEKFIESISRISCKNAKYGCKKTGAYSKKGEHEQMCPHAMCNCPHPLCPFAGSFKNLYRHFGIEHASSTTRFTYNTTFIHRVELNQKQMFLQEQLGSVVFILNHEVQEHGRAFNVECVGPSTLKTCFVHQLTAESMDTSLSLKSVPEIYTEWSKHTPTKNYLTVPSEFARFNGILSLSVCINKVISSEFEAEAEEEEVEVWENDHNSNKALLVVLSDPDVLDCSICFEPLYTPVFQCQKGHLVCSSCCSSMKRICLLSLKKETYNRCRGLEKVIESIRISCKNFGCKKTMAYSSKNEHEQACPHAPCFCPHPSCPFASSSKNLYLHFGIQHAASTTRFTYNTTFSLCVDINQKHVFVQEQHENVIFILNHQVLEHGRVFNIDCVGTSALSSYFVYHLTVESMETSLTLKSVPKVYTKWSKYTTPTKNCLTIPCDFVGYNGLLPLSVCIKEGGEALRWIIFGDD